MEAAINSNENDDDVDNPYIALRRRNIARNEARLRELGLLRYPPQTSIIIREENEKHKQRKRTAIAKRRTQIPVRRSSRRAFRPIGYEVVPAERTKSNKHSIEVTSSNDCQKTPTKSSLEVAADKATSPVELPTKTYPANSARNISIDIHRLVSKYLAKPVTATGKSAVVEETARQFSDINGTDTIVRFPTISFNKYCGVQEWKRGIFLWVNLGGDQGNINNFVNEFLDGGRRMTWYAGSRMHAESNAILKLLKVGSAAARSNVDDDLDSAESDGIVLWCRRYEAEKRTFGKYHCLGRLAYYSHDPSSIPISFVWTLLDYDRLVAQKNDLVLHMMQV